MNLTEQNCCDVKTIHISPTIPEDPNISLLRCRGGACSVCRGAGMAYRHACMHACMHAYIHTYIHTYSEFQNISHYGMVAGLTAISSLRKRFATILPEHVRQSGISSLKLKQLFRGYVFRNPFHTQIRQANKTHYGHQSLLWDQPFSCAIKCRRRMGNVIPF